MIIVCSFQAQEEGSATPEEGEDNGNQTTTKNKKIPIFFFDRWDFACKEWAKMFLSTEGFAVVKLLKLDDVTNVEKVKSDICPFSQNVC